jgi:hypothetical protein
MAVLHPAFELILIQKIRRALLIAEEKPVAPFRTGREAFLEERE